MRTARSRFAYRPLALSFAVTVVAACGGSSPPPKSTASTAPSSGGGGGSYDSSSLKCAPKDHVHHYDLHDPDGDDAMVPCSKDGKDDYAGLIHIETLDDGIHITIHATDDQVDLGALGADVKQRDAVIVYPKGPGSEAVEVPLMKTSDGYTGDKIIFWDKLDKITDEGTKIDVAIYDHDKNGDASEEMHVAVAVSAGKSCEKAMDESSQNIDMGKKGAKDLTADQLGAPIKSSGYFANCGLPDSSKAEICATVHKGKPIGVSVRVTPQSNKTAACIDRATRRLSFPVSDNTDQVKQTFD
jgi:hypothetical protein